MEVVGGVRGGLQSRGTTERRRLVAHGGSDTDHLLCRRRGRCLLGHMLLLLLLLLLVCRGGRRVASCPRVAGSGFRSIERCQNGGFATECRGHCATQLRFWVCRDWEGLLLCLCLCLGGGGSGRSVTLEMVVELVYLGERSLGGGRTRTHGSHATAGDTAGLDLAVKSGGLVRIHVRVEQVGRSGGLTL